MQLLIRSPKPEKNNTIFKISVHKSVFRNTQWQPLPSTWALHTQVCVPLMWSEGFSTPVASYATAAGEDQFQFTLYIVQ